MSVIGFAGAAQFAAVGYVADKWLVGFGRIAEATGVAIIGMGVMLIAGS